MQPKLSIKNLSKTFKTGNQIITVLEDISFSIYSGEFVSVIGPSGCGKSTLCNIMAGIDEPTSGTIAIDEIYNKNRLGKSGYMLQKPLLLPWKTVEENVMLGLTIENIPHTIAQQKAQALLTQFGLQEFSHHFPETLSGGMAQRIALLRTILFNKDLLLMDEPFGALDSLTRFSMHMWLLDIWKEFSSSVLFVTHDIREAVFLSDRIFVLSNRPGKIIEEVEVTLSRPRKREVLQKKEAIQLEKNLEDLLLNQQSV